MSSIMNSISLFSIVHIPETKTWGNTLHNFIDGVLYIPHLQTTYKVTDIQKGEVVLDQIEPTAKDYLLTTAKIACIYFAGAKILAFFAVLVVIDRLCHRFVIVETSKKSDVNISKEIKKEEKVDPQKEEKVDPQKEQKIDPLKDSVEVKVPPSEKLMEDFQYSSETSKQFIIDLQNLEKEQPLNTDVFWHGNFVLPSEWDERGSIKNFEEFVKEFDISTIDHKILSKALHLLIQKNKNSEKKLNEIIICLMKNIKNPIAFLTHFFVNYHELVYCFQLYYNFPDCFYPVEGIVKELDAKQSGTTLENVHLLLNISGLVLCHISNKVVDCIIEKLLEGANAKVVAGTLNDLIQLSKKNEDNKILSNLGRRATRLFTLSPYLHSLNLTLSEKLDLLNKSYKIGDDPSKFDETFKEIEFSISPHEIISAYLLNLKNCSDALQSNILIPRILSKIDLYSKDKKPEDLIPCHILWFSRSFISDQFDLVSSWQTDLIKYGTKEQYLAWFQKAQRFYLSGYSEKQANLLVEFFKHNKSEDPQILNSMDSAIDKLILTEPSLTHLKGKVFEFLTQSAGNEKAPLHALIRLKHFLKNIEKLKAPEFENVDLNKLSNEVNEKLKNFNSKDSDSLKNLQSIVDCVKKEFKEDKVKNAYLKVVKKFFEEKIEQLLENKKILLPQYYHSTPLEGLKGILTNKQIEVRQEKLHAGAWTSTHRESQYGDYCIALDKSINKKAQGAQRGSLTSSGAYWVGFRDPIDLIFNKQITASHFSVPENQLDVLDSLLNEGPLNIPILSHLVSDKIGELVRKTIPLDLVKISNSPF